MRKFAVVLLVIGFAHVSAFGGVISFDPDKAVVDRDAGDSDLVKLNVFIGGLTEIGNAFGSFNLVFGSNDGLEIVSFEWDDVLLLSTSTFFPPSIQDNQRSDIYADDIKVGIFINPVTNTSGGPSRIGSLVVDTTGLDFGKYQVLVNGDIDQESAAANGTFELLFGTASVNVIPEPATISLLGLASLALIRRRKKA